jgi:hypothetical protein
MDIGYYRLTNVYNNSQFIKAPGYIQVTGLFNQTGVGLKTSDSGVFFFGR